MVEVGSIDRIFAPMYVERRRIIEEAIWHESRTDETTIGRYNRAMAHTLYMQAQGIRLPYLRG